MVRYFFLKAVLTRGSLTTQNIVKPKLTDRARVVQQLIKSTTPVASVRGMVKNIKHMSTELFKGMTMHTQLSYRHMYFVHICLSIYVFIVKYFR